MNELDLTPEQYIALFVVILLLLTYELYRFYHDSEVIELPEEEPADLLLNPNYGAYIQAQGRYYN